MAFVTGTAQNTEDLFEKLIAFLTTDPVLVREGQAWSTAWRHPDSANTQRVLRGPGLAGADAVYIGLSTTILPEVSAYYFNIWGMTGVIGSARGIEEHVNVCPNRVRMFADNGPMTYWFIANGRRFMCVVKISTVFESMYAGLILPYGTPLTYPYPLFIGGTAGDLGPTSWRSVDSGHSAFPFSYYTTSSGSQRNPCAHLLSPDAQWLRCVGTHYDNPSVGDVNIHPNKRSGAWPYFPSTTGSSTPSPGVGVIEARERIAPAKDGTMTLENMHLVREWPFPTIYGVFDGVHRTVGIDNASENLITVEDVGHLVVQNTYRTTARDYVAFKLD